MGKLLTLVVLLVAVGLFIYASSKPIYRLRSAMPPEFVDVQSSRPAETQAAEEEKIARAYWDCAVTSIQWRYGYGYRLPQDPPSDFIVTSPDLREAAGDPMIRVRYWHALLRIWYVPDYWTKSYMWDTRWLTSWIDSVRRLHSD